MTCKVLPILCGIMRRDNGDYCAHVTVGQIEYFGLILDDALCGELEAVGDIDTVHNATKLCLAIIKDCLLSAKELMERQYEFDNVSDSSRRH